MTRLPISPLAPRSSALSVFTGTEVIVWGGRGDSVGAATPAIPARGASTNIDLGDGAAYNVNTGRWRNIASAPISARFAGVAVWTGREMIVVGGMGGDFRVPRSAAAYDPVHDRWRRLADAPTCISDGTWTGRQLVAIGSCGSGPATGAMFDPVTNRWTALPAQQADPTEVVRVGSRIVGWNSDSNVGWALDTRTRHWHALPKAPLPASGETAVAIRSIAFAVDEHTFGIVFPASRADGTVFYSYDLDSGAWIHRSDLHAAGPGVLDGPEGQNGNLVRSGDWVAWETGGEGYGVYNLASGAAATVGPVGIIRLDRIGASLAAIGGGRFFVWGGRLAASNNDPVARPASDGVIVTGS